MAAARAIAAIVDDDELREDYIIPSVFNRDVAPAVAAAVAEEARAPAPRGPAASSASRPATPPPAARASSQRRAARERDA